MAANKKPRKKYRPKPVLTDPVSFVVRGTHRPEPEDIAEAQGVNRQCLQAFIEGTATLAEWKKLVGGVNVSLALAEASPVGGYGNEYFDDLEHAQKALTNIALRWKKWGKWQITELEAALIDHALDVHQAQLEAATIRDVELAQKSMWDRLQRPSKRIDINPDLPMYELKETVSVPV